MPAYVSRPQRLPYSPKALLHLPYRLFNPPPAPCKTKTWQMSPDYKVELDDVLDNRHLSPMALKDFEEFLLFTEFSAENLYFLMWLKEYKRKYQDLGVSKTAAGDLAVQFSRALATFFDPTSNLALNLPADITSSIIAISKESSHPPPVVFDQVVLQVKGMLRDSLMRFVRLCYGNAGTNRSWFSAWLGISLVVLGLIPTIASIVTGTSRWIRLSGFLLFWCGSAATIAATHGLCLILYSFGDGRQLHPYELAAPRLPTTILLGDPPEDEERKIAFTSSVSDHDSMSGLLTASFIAPPAYTEVASPMGGAFKFDFDALPPTPKSAASQTDPNSSRDSLVSSSPTFGSITRVLNPLIRRSHWEVAIKSLTLGLLFAIIFSAVCVVLPFRRTH
ncbi:hypothetical protein M407DRAFT_228557 [Tulasnella calospora MUT 4182]|uniref:RGS domain-containing protein n=1 Tax=Tulasnella calospora MUT 4182 TaxID=1051891 RepID=A0A0C3M6B4_9AGAM|nr:hypothetical protein M407DRAFT_228557 [Tulasnella calospora MUT 4182]